MSKRCEKSWRDIEKESIRDIDALLDFLKMDKEKREAIEKKSLFPLYLPIRLAKKIEKNSLNDPIFRQFIPLKEERKKETNFIPDPLCEKRYRKEKSLIQKYKNRALLYTTSHCAMNCRFCFRKHFSKSKAPSSFSKEIEALRKSDDINEIILSGGDPLFLEDSHLESILRSLETIASIKRIRIHTRFPIAIPERITDSLLSIVSKCKKQIILVLHINHVKEWDGEVAEALKKIQKIPIPILTQTVLLKGINDTLFDLQSLFEAVSDQGILPYYLHQLDRIEGSSHFEVSIEKGKELIYGLRENLSGYSIPRYVQEIPSKKSKTLIL